LTSISLALWCLNGTAPMQPKTERVDPFHRALYRRRQAVSGTTRIMAAVFAIAIVAVLLAIGLLAAFGPKLLLSWHLREVSRMKIAEKPDEAIVTYPLA
jgi:hypothetical protein